MLGVYLNHCKQPMIERITSAANVGVQTGRAEGTLFHIANRRIYLPKSRTFSGWQQQEWGQYYD